MGGFDLAEMARAYEMLVGLLTLSFSSGSLLDFMVMGDWGGFQVWPYKTPGEIAVAKHLGVLAEQHNASFTLALGDNFYMHGVTDQHDPRFKQTFEDVFTSSSLQSPNHFRVLAGNHDHYGNCSAQIAYSDMSPRWYFPDYYYSMEEMAGNLTVQLVMIDTVVLS